MEDTAGQSAFNAALEYLYELSTIRKRLHEARINKDFDYWFTLLISYYTALHPRMKKKTELLTKNEEKFNIIWCDFNKWKISGKPIPNKLIMDFLIWEQDLRDSEDKLGLLMANKDDPAFAMGGTQF